LRVAIFGFLLSFLLCLVSSSARAELAEVRFDLYKLQHQIGTEIDYVDRHSDGSSDISAVFGFNDRTTSVPLAASLTLGPAGEPRRFRLWGRTSRPRAANDLVEVRGRRLAITQQGASRTEAAPARFFVGSSYAPMIVLESLLRYWTSHGRPGELPVYPLGRVTVERRGQDTVVKNDGKSVVLERYALGGVLWGKVTVWLDGQGALAAFKGTDTDFDHFEATRAGYSQALSTFVTRAAADGMAALAEASRGLGSDARGTVAYVGARLIDGTGRPPVGNATILVRDGRLSAVGPGLAAPPGVRTVDLAGKTVIPGLWDMHAHIEQVEWGPLYLAAGVTTVRDCGNELDFIRSVRDAVDAGKGVGPHILLACLVDGDGEAVIGQERLRSTDEIPGLIKRFGEAGCAQVKVYSSLPPALLAPLAQAAHRAGMTVTGHAPNGMGAVRAVQAGFDQINHVDFVARALAPSRWDPNAFLDHTRWQKSIIEADLESPSAKETVTFFSKHGTVVDPTLAEGELFALPPAEERAHEPGLAKVAPPLRQALAGASPEGDSADARAYFAKLLAVVKALHKAGVPIVAGTDQAVPGHSIHRELELYVEAGFTPMEAIQSATLVPARVMNKQNEVGTVEAGKRADFVVVDGDPLADIRATRRISLVVAAGRSFDPAALWRSVDFVP
jgi:imidazolonepropionase-like amidohydrolase